MADATEVERLRAEVARLQELDGEMARAHNANLLEMGDLRARGQQMRAALEWIKVYTDANKAPKRTSALWQDIWTSAHQALLAAEAPPTAAHVHCEHVEPLRAALKKSALAYHHEMHVVRFQSREAIEECSSPVCKDALLAAEAPTETPHG